MPYIIRWRRAMAAIDQRDTDEALRQARLGLDSMPSGTEMALDVVRALEGIGRSDIADLLYADARQHFSDQLRDAPDSPFLHNELAWIDAQCHRGLEEALGHAERAVEIRPRHAGYVDTLAEVHFQRGDRERAIEMAQRSVELAPANPHFRDRLEAFRTRALPEPQRPHALPNSDESNSNHGD